MGAAQREQERPCCSEICCRTHCGSPGGVVQQAHVDHVEQRKPVTCQARRDQGVDHACTRERQIVCAQRGWRAWQCSARTPLHPRRRPSHRPIAGNCAKFATSLLGGRGKRNFGNRSFSQMIYICSTIHLSEIPVPYGVRGRGPFRSTNRASEARLVLVVPEPHGCMVVQACSWPLSSGRGCWHAHWNHCNSKAAHLQAALQCIAAIDAHGARGMKAPANSVYLL